MGYPGGVALLVDRQSYPLFEGSLAHSWSPLGTQLSPVASRSCSMPSGHTPETALTGRLNQVEGAIPTISVEPNDITIGLTETMHLECFVKNQDLSAADNLISLVVSHSDNLYLHSFTNIASVSSFNGVHTSLTSSHVRVVGSINRNGLSSLNITWSYPLLQNSGVYKCQANEIDELGQPITYDKNFSVAVKVPTIDAVVSEIVRLRNRLDQNNLNCVTSHDNEISNLNLLKENISSLANQTSLLKDKCETDLVHLQNLESQNKIQLTSVENSVKSVTLKYDDLLNRLNGFKTEFFKISQVFGGKKYLLTRESSFFYPIFAQSICSIYGGYLVEVNSPEEFTFLKAFLTSEAANSDYIFTGGTDEGHEGHWTYKHSNSTSLVSLWQHGQPDNYQGQENCEAFTKLFGWNLNDANCTFAANPVGFMCEITA
ncbi:C-type lectin domain family 4 member K [Biomphalaria pfeifferi]|uniref:C-type lectin domain family 4 member K n=1 Tax=Biomphalaria pfeifferi TaxID=112525 RepID=A0AAD8BIW5_BIOPF|nr:C-type lectin domain family 4 member K [Biomphalaria pfeifferi]